MGLDVYLYTRQQAEANGRYEEAVNAFYEREDWPSEERDKARAALPAYESRTNVPSEKHPDHLFNRRYLRSSYNGSGFDAAVPEMVGADHGLYWIFEPVRLDDDYEIELTEADIPGLETAKARALTVADELRACDPLRTCEASAFFGSQEHMWSDLPTEEQVLAWYREERERNSERDDFDGGYSNAKGMVFGFKKGMEVLAATVGKNIIGQPAAILVFRLGDEAKQSYVASAEITAEFCDEAIALIRKDGSCSMHWSG
ncbi:hypothetical protein [Actinomadura nitritigenes]|uniref:hypothetical protein n=1 Tax=Actinomadura nitritigenes TaxID=134602 RepID=UPI003D8B6041